TINYAQSSNVTITGGEGSDAVTGGSGADVIGGFTGNDTLYGGIGADTLSGAAGNDLLYGGAGNDVFGYAATDTGQIDVIGDFAAGDVIRVGSATLGGITSGTGTGLAARGVQVGTTSGGFTPLYVDLDGNGGVADLTINLAGSFTASGLQVTGNEISVYTPPPSTGGGGGGDSGGGTTRTVDGVTVQQTTQTGSDGTRTETITVPIVTAGRTEENAATPNADIPLVTGTGGRELLTAHVPVGVGLTVESTTTTAQGVQGLIRAIQNRTQDRPNDQQEMTGVGQSFLDVLPPATNLTVRTIVPVVANPAAPPAAPIVITGTPTTPATGGGTEQQAVVIDVRNLPKGTVIQLQNVEFAAIVGAVSVTGGAGSQIVVGDGEDQVIVLGADDDTLRGGGGNDFVGSEGGDDVLFGDGGYDTVTGGIGNDALYGNQQDDVVYGNQGLDTLFGGQDLDTLFGGQDGDVLYGNRAADVLYGNLGSDTLFGGQDNDVLFGGQGDDLLAGNLGSDTLTGGLGADVFVLASPSGGADAIADFTAGSDRIAVSGPNFGSLPVGGLASTHFALDNPATADTRFVFDTRSGVLSFDADGSGAGAALAIATLNVRTLSHTDILVFGPGG
ncbi:calcium-binding protein, partial [Azospirillum sp.]|uniref:calcium-binding protein n=1 Tax=Azospirillum sp. TaxID=34012 RepID=UPI002D4879EE